MATDSISVENSPLIASFPEFESPAIVLVTSANFAGERQNRKKEQPENFNSTPLFINIFNIHPRTIIAFKVHPETRRIN